MIGIPMHLANRRKAVPIAYADYGRGVQACYFPGSGLGGTFLEHLYNSTSGMDIDDDCKDVYQYIVTHYTGRQEIWMFGLSRGSYTVRSVCGIINNCGIIKQTTSAGTRAMHTINSLCNEVYLIYRSPYPEDVPHSKRSLEFQCRVSHNVSTPIKFMGILDTVGAMGVPKFDSGIGLTFPEFHDQKISSVVEKVYHACAIHDRLWILNPAVRFDAVIQRSHDLKFTSGGSLGVTTISNFWVLRLLEKVIEPNEVLADLVLKWMLESIKTEDPYDNVIPNIDMKIGLLITKLKNGTNTGSGDVYDNILWYGPGGKLFEVGSKMADNIVKYLDWLPLVQAIGAQNGLLFAQTSAKEGEGVDVVFQKIVQCVYTNITANTIQGIGLAPGVRVDELTL
ncbi:hypothetical protein BGZ92_009827 [Podila epicladia]|nr:hypothetical protein BGZ92_009827 [Podila epicladia]